MPVRFLRPLRRGVGMLAVAVIALVAPAYAGAEASPYLAKVDAGLATVVQTAEARFAEERQQRENAFREEQQRLAVDAVERSRQHEQAFRDAERQLERAFATLRRDHQKVFAAGSASRARAYRSAATVLEARFRLELRRAAPAARKQLVTLRAFRREALARTFRVESARRSAAFAATDKRRATAYAAAKASREAGLKVVLAQLDAEFQEQGNARESSFADAQRAKQNEHAATSLQAIAFGSAVDAAREQVGAELRHRLKLIGAQALTIRLGDLQQLIAEPGISRLALDAPTHATVETAPSSPLTPLAFPALTTLYPTITGASDVWAQGYTGAGIGIAVLDSGVAPISDLAGRLGHATIPGLSDSAVDEVGHGTFAASVAAGRSSDGRYVGIAPGATVHGVNVSQGGSAHSSDVIKGLEWVFENRTARNIRVAVLALSESMPSSYRTSALDFAIEQLWQNGVVVVVSSGNSGPNTMQYAPGNDPFAITVGASDSNGTVAENDDTLATFSSYGRTLDGHVKPDLVAPGRHIVASLLAGTHLDTVAPPANHVETGYGRMNGTSFSAPQVAGAVAILLEKHPSWTPDQVKRVLAGTTDPLAGSTAGALDLVRALAFDGVPASANVGIDLSGGPATASSLRTELNAVLLDDALSLEYTADTLEKSGVSYQEAASAWQQASQLWLGALDVPYRGAIAGDRAAAAWLKAGFPGNAASAWDSAGAAAERVLAWRLAAVYHGLAANTWESTTSFDRAARAWERASRASEALAAQTSEFEAKAIAWIKAISAREYAASNWRSSSALVQAAAADALYADVKARAIEWANASWTNASWTNASWTNASWTNASWTNASWTNASWTNASWTNASWNFSSWD